MIDLILWLEKEIAVCKDDDDWEIGYLTGLTDALEKAKEIYYRDIAG